jgi:hypothetical protein
MKQERNHKEKKINRNLMSFSRVSIFVLSSDKRTNCNHSASFKIAELNPFMVALNEINKCKINKQTKTKTNKPKHNKTK